MPLNEKTELSTLKILVVDDEQSVVDLLRDFTSQKIGLEFQGCSSAKEALSWAETNYFDIAFVDYKMPEMNGLDLIKRLKSKRPESFFIIMTAYAELNTAIQAIRSHVFDFLSKPFGLHEFELSIERARKQIKLQDQNIFLRNLLHNHYGRGELIGQSTAIASVRTKIDLFSRSGTQVLITGETGVGKEVVARMIHAQSNRNKSAFVAVNCSAFVETLLESELFGHEKGAFTGADHKRIGRLELAREGTILLDEICETPPSIQVKLLRVLQEKEFERVGGNESVKLKARIISTTNRNVEYEIQNNHFREDLYYRLNTFLIHIPPLRERKEDIGFFASYFLKKFSLIYNKEISSFSDGAMEIIRNHPWPGNVRQFANVIDYAVLSCNSEQINEEHFPEKILEEFMPDHSKSKRLKTVHSQDDLTVQKKLDPEQQKIMAILEKNRWNKSKAASQLNMTRGQLLYRMKKFGIE